MDLPAKPLPAYLVERYQDWENTIRSEDTVRYRRLANEGQNPREMIVSCCDSRVHVTSMFEAQAGEFFVHRNIASLVPPCTPNGDRHGTSAAVEYGVTVLNVAHLIVAGHSDCGGVRGCYDMCSGKAPHLEYRSSFVGGWLDILRPGFERLDPNADEISRLRALEHESVLISLENLMTFPFIRERVELGTLTLHGVWIDINDGKLMAFDPDEKAFVFV